MTTSMIMKKLILIGTATITIGFISGCADREVRSSTTTTEETTVQHPVQQTTTTETVRPAY